MSLGKLLLRPQLVTDTAKPTVRQLGVSADFVFRLSQALLADQTAQNIFQEAFESLSAEFIRDHDFEVEQALDHLLGWIQPLIDTAEHLAAAFNLAEATDIPSLASDIICTFIQSLSPNSLEGGLNRLLDVVENDLQTIISDLPDKLLLPILDQLTAKLQEDFLAGDASPAALNRYTLARDINCLRPLIMEAFPSIQFDRELIFQAVSGLLAGLAWDNVTTRITALCEAVRDIVPHLQTLVRAQFSVSFSGSLGIERSNPHNFSGNPGIKTASLSVGSGMKSTLHNPGLTSQPTVFANPGSISNDETPRRYLWYASWLLGKDLFQQGEKIFEDDLKVLFRANGLFRASLEGGGELLTARETFAAHDITLSQSLVVTTEAGKPIWVLHDSGRDKTYTIIEEGGELDVYEGRVYLEADWSKIDFLKPYTFKRVTPATCDLLAWIMNFGGEYLEMIFHAASIESKDFVANLLNLLIHGTYGSLKVVGPRGFGWIKRDLPMRNPWLNWVLPIGVTTLASVEGIHTKDEAPSGLIYWLTLLGADLSEKFLYDHWAYMLRDAVLSTFTLLNYNGDKAVPASPQDTRPLNRKHIDGVVNLFVEGGVWIVAALYPKSDFGFPNNDNLGKLGIHFGHWFGFGAIAAVVSNLVGSAVAWSVGWVVDGKAYGWMNLRAYVFVLAKYNFYQYFTHDGKTNGGKFDGSGDSYPGYPADKENSPYKLPYEKDTTYACAQGNLGIWSHTAHSFESQIYAFDFAMDKGDVILACRGGVVDDFDDTFADHNTEDPNFIRIRHGEFKSETYGTGDGATLIFPHTLGSLPVLPGTVFVTDTVETFTDNGRGTLTGSAGGAGNVNYTTGVCSITFNAAPANAQAITAVYVQATSETYGTGNGANVTFAHTLASLPVQPGSVFITDTVETFTDNRSGVLNGSAGGTGAINYATGVCAITFNTAPVNGRVITVVYTTVHPHDRDRNNVPTVTYATYLHGTKQGVSEVWAEKLGVDVSTITTRHIRGQAVQQGEPIMKAGDTGRSAYNHLHLHLKPQIMGSEGNYTIPFVFADVDEDDGVPRSLDPYESGNERK